MACWVLVHEDSMKRTTSTQCLSSPPPVTREIIKVAPDEFVRQHVDGVESQNWGLIASAASQWIILVVFYIYRLCQGKQNSNLPITIGKVLYKPTSRPAIRNQHRESMADCVVQPGKNITVSNYS